MLARTVAGYSIRVCRTATLRRVAVTLPVVQTVLLQVILYEYTHTVLFKDGTRGPDTQQRTRTYGIDVHVQSCLVELPVRVTVSDTGTQVQAVTPVFHIMLRRGEETKNA